MPSHAPWRLQVLIPAKYGERAMAEGARCSHYKCDAPGAYIVELAGKNYLLCKRHYEMLLKILREVSQERGSASLRDMKIIKRSNGILFSH